LLVVALSDRSQGDRALATLIDVIALALATYILLGYGNFLKLEVIPAVGGMLFVAVLLFCSHLLHKRPSR